MAKKRTKNKHLGSTLDSFLEDEGILEEVTARAQKKVLAYQLAEAMKAQNISKSEMARRMSTSRSQIDNLLNPDNNRFRIDTAQKAAAALGKTLIVGLV
jgi:predicted XRE-type DNA-binding protein|tara:strand:- start:225 stop:521 length:297 start_codon:yes stop_codon:yes gene_type:complete